MHCNIEAPEAAERSYRKEFGVAMAAYIVVVPVSVTLLEHHPHAWWRFLVALAPVAAVVLAAVAFVRFLSRMDELQRRIQLGALAFGFGGSGLLTFTYGWLENAGLPSLSYIWVLPLMIALWGIGVAVGHRRYR
jgi:hypothetical protein